MNKFGISLYFDQRDNILEIYGIRFFEVDNHSTPYKTIQILTNDKPVKQIPLSLLEKLSLQTLLFPDTPVIFKENDKIGIKFL